MGTQETDLSHLVAETGVDPSMAIRKLKTCEFGSGSPVSALVLSLYKRDRVIKVLWHFLGTAKEHMVYEAKGVRAAMGLHLLKSLNNCLTSSVLLGFNSQALLKALSNQKSHTGHYILDKIHTAAERFHAKQDRIVNSRDHTEARRLGHSWKCNTKGVVDLCLMWVLGHLDFEPNKCADVEAKKAAQGDTS